MLKAATIAIAILWTSVPARAETPVATDVLSKAQVRERLAACGSEWQQMKRTGADGSLIWREFSKICMARKTPPRPQSGRRASAGAPAQNENAPPLR